MNYEIKPDQIKPDCMRWLAVIYPKVAKRSRVTKFFLTVRILYVPTQLLRVVLLHKVFYL